MPSLSMHVRAKPLQVASALRRFMSMRGYSVLPPRGDEVAAVEFRLVPPGTSGLTAVFAEPPDQIDEVLASTLSQSLRTLVFSLVRGGDVFALQSWNGGHPLERVGVVRGQLVEGEPGELASAILAGEEQSVLDARGIELDHPDARAIVVGFAQAARPGRTALVVDPLLSCPRCGSPMAERKGRFGAFFGCLRFPQCDGKLSSAEADAQRKSNQ